MRNIDLDQMVALRAFEGQIQKAGAFTKTFKDADALKFEVNILLDRLARQYVNSEENQDLDGATSKDVDVAVVVELATSLESAEDIGLYDILENLGESAALATKFLEDLTENLTTMSGITDEVTSEFEQIKVVRPLEVSEIKPRIRRIAESMDDFSSFIETEIPAYGENLSAMVGNVRDLIRVSYDWIGSDKEMPSTLLSFHASLSEIRDVMTATHDSLNGMMASVGELPRTTVQFNKSRRRMIHSGSGLVEVNDNGRGLIVQAIDEIERLMIVVRNSESNKISHIST